GPGTNFDQVAVTGGNGAAVGATSALNVLLTNVDLTAPFWQTPESWPILTNAGGSVTGNFASLLNATYPQGSFSTVNQGSQVALVWTPVPEPATPGLVALGFAALAYGRRRRRHRRA